MTTDSRVRLGVVGLGLIAQAVHLPNLRTLRDIFDVVHMCDLSPTLTDQLAREWGGPVRTSTDPAEVFADPDVDAVLLLTPGTHSALTEQALRAGKHVLAEKPFAYSVAEAESCADLAQDRGLVLQVGYMKMYEPMLDRARVELARLGRIRLVRVTVLHPTQEQQTSHVRHLRYDDADPDAVAAAVEEERRRLDAAVGDLDEPFRSIYSDVLQASVCHEFSLLRGLLDDMPVAFSAAQVGTATVGEQLKEPPQVQALGTVGEAQLMLSWNWLSGHPEYGEELAVFGDSGSLYLHLPAPYTLNARAVLDVERMDGLERSTNRMRGEPRTGFDVELEAFHASVTAGAGIRSTARGAARDTAAMWDLTQRLIETHTTQ
ncbi:gfo/Idh/MocA family oxidoreductase [Actinobacteria bacterium YIM 96077]|uniref:Gfo/Idh/MocA family oxidoreductase n=1 Tax=Phytoactinopolyspora halophila TaxID=1981511 RepID=A0A329QST9_9ACTN|nr:Gfo/Idh/MocA family oxidoreductase [Phytoactinopolyspora halophila]AYY14987.1 gfo/Idh/MocA family oxidoreductase [Actinobacteria bacterium YIM 96077]RAW15444.1 gfo/Idh/MocA family oxidoreductase [Phytoactinopolyspora halophila]